MVILVILFYLIIGIIEIMPLVVKKQKRELVLYGILYGIAFVTSILISLGVDIPSPAKPIEKIVFTIIGKQR